MTYGSRKITSADSQISVSSIVERMEWLACDLGEEADPMTAQWPDQAERAEYMTLRTLLAEIEEVTGESGDAIEHVTIVCESEWVDYVKEWHGDTWGAPWIKTDKYGHPKFDHDKGRHVHVSWSELMSTEPFMFIDWQAVANHQRKTLCEVEWEGFTWIIA